MAFNGSSIGQQRFKCHTCDGPDCRYTQICHNAITVTSLVVIIVPKFSRTLGKVIYLLIFDSVGNLE